METGAYTIREMVKANKQRFVAEDLQTLFQGAEQVIVARGKKALRFDLGAGAELSTVAEVALGRSGTLRAPALRLGTTWLVGFHEEAWREVFAGPTLGR